MKKDPRIPTTMNSKDFHGSNPKLFDNTRSTVVLFKDVALQN